MRPRPTLATTCALLALAACSPDANHDTATLLEPSTPMYAKPAPLGDPSATFLFPANSTGLGVSGDGRSVSGDDDVYADGVCAISAKIFATEAASNSGDAVLNMQAKGTGRCGRALTISYGDGDVRQVPAAFVNVNHIHNTSFQIPIGQTVMRGMNLADERCQGLRWKGRLNDGTVTGADSVLVTRVDASTWLVQTQPAPADKAYCLSDGLTYHIPVRFRIVSSRPM